MRLQRFPPTRYVSGRGYAVCTHTNVTINALRAWVRGYVTICSKLNRESSCIVWLYYACNYTCSLISSSGQFSGMRTVQGRQTKSAFTVYTAYHHPYQYYIRNTQRSSSK